MYRLTYKLTKDDFLAFNRFVEKRFSGQVRLNRYFSPLAAGFVLFVFLYVDTDSLGIALLGGVLMFLIFLPLWLLFLRNRLKRGAAQWAAGANTDREREVLIDSSGFRERTEINDCFFTWEGIEFVGITPTHLIVHETALTAFIVPREHLDPGAIDLIRTAVPASKRLEAGA